MPRTIGRYKIMEDNANKEGKKGHGMLGETKAPTGSKLHKLYLIWWRPRHVASTRNMSHLTFTDITLMESGVEY
jgi:hypothetical protein